MQSNVLFPMEAMFATNLPTCKPKAGRHERLVKIAQQAFPGKQNLFIDCASSLQRPTHCEEVCPCLTPEHPVYSTFLKRYLGPADHLNLQGIFQTAITKETYQFLMDNPNLCQDLCGNSFTSTTFQAVFLSALAVGGQVWDTVGCQPQPSAQKDQSKQMAVHRRCRFKRPAPEFDELAKGAPHQKRRKAEETKHFPVPQAQPAARRCIRKSKRKYRPVKEGQDGRKENSGKKETYTLWDKEMVTQPQSVFDTVCIVLHRPY